MNNELLQIEASIEEVKTRKDRTLKIILGTQELEQGDAAKMLGMANKLGWFVFKEVKILENEIINIPDETTEFPKQKTSSERLRNALFILHQKMKGKPEEFEDFRKKQMEKLIEWVKEKINKYE